MELILIYAIFAWAIVHLAGRVIMTDNKVPFARQLITHMDALCGDGLNCRACGGVGTVRATGKKDITGDWEFACDACETYIYASLTGDVSQFYHEFEQRRGFVYGRHNKEKTNA